MKRSNRTVPQQIRLSPEEKRAFTKLAEDRGIDFSNLVRQLLHKELNSSKVQAA
jgi:hypothetical protein